MHIGRGQSTIALYAKAGIAKYWILNLKEHTLEVYRNPEEYALQPAIGYKLTMRLLAKDSISPLIRPDMTIPVAEMLP